jgi:Ankyrin repeats (many copies)
LIRSNPNSQDSSGQTPSHTAAWNEQYDIVKLLLELGTDVINMRNGNEKTPLDMGLEKGNSPVFLKSAFIHPLRKSCGPRIYEIKRLVRDRADIKTELTMGDCPSSGFPGLGNSIPFASPGRRGLSRRRVHGDIRRGVWLRAALAFGCECLGWAYHRSCGPLNSLWLSQVR